MVPSVPASVLIPVAIAGSLIPVAGFLSVAFGGRSAAIVQPLRLATFVALGLLAWGLLAIGLAALHIGFGHTHWFTAPLLALAWFVPQVLAVLGVRRAPRLRAALANRSGLWRVTSIQVARSLGLVFLILHGEHKLPGLFTYPAACGDVAVGVLAPLATWVAFYRYEEIMRPGTPWRRWFIGFNLLGLADHVNAVILGTGSFPGSVFHTDPTTAVFAGLPMVLFPLFLVPFADTAHLLALDAIRWPAAVRRRADSRTKFDRSAMTMEGVND